MKSSMQVSVGYTGNVNTRGYIHPLVYTVSPATDYVFTWNSMCRLYGFIEPSSGDSVSIFRYSGIWLGHGEHDGRNPVPVFGDLVGALGTTLVIWHMTVRNPIPYRHGGTFTGRNRASPSPHPPPGGFDC